MRQRETIISSLIDSLDWPTACATILDWASRRESRVVCICNVHSVVTARNDPALNRAINEADLATPDGMPVAWLIGRRRGIAQARINGPDLTVRLCQAAAEQGIGVAFYGSTPETLERLSAALVRQFPRLEVSAMISPPFRQLDASEQEVYLTQLNQSGAGIIFVGLGCPKQEIWMAAHRERLQGVQIGVGAAFEFMAGTVKRPPRWMQRAGLEWLGRLLAEPRRLWRRYLHTNSVYIGYVLRELATRSAVENSRSNG